MRRLLILIILTNGLWAATFGQETIRMNFVQPDVLIASAGHDTVVCNYHPVILGGNPTARGGSNSYLYVWSPPDGLDDPTSSNPTATLTESKTYMLSVFDTQGCQSVSFISVYIDPCLGIEENKLDPAITVFPNPSNGVFTIQGLGNLNSKMQRIEVINQLGQIIYYKEFKQEYYLSELVVDTNIKEAGIYFLRISFANRIVSQRLIVR